MTTQVRSIFNSTDKFPVYSHYAGQILPQPAFISLDCRTGEVSADYSGEIGNAVPSTVWHGLELRFTINSMATADDITTMIEDNMSRFQAIVDGFEDVWNGNNWVGRFTDEAQRHIDELQEPGHFASDEPACIQTLAEFIEYGQKFPEPDQTVDAFAQDILDCNGENNYWLPLDMHDLNGLKEGLLDLWAEELYIGRDIPRHVALILLADGRCEDSACMDELREFAGQ